MNTKDNLFYAVLKEDLPEGLSKHQYKADDIVPVVGKSPSPTGFLEPYDTYYIPNENTIEGSNGYYLFGKNLSALLIDPDRWALVQIKEDVKNVASSLALWSTMVATAGKYDLIDLQSKKDFRPTYPCVVYSGRQFTLDSNWLNIVEIPEINKIHGVEVSEVKQPKKVKEHEFDPDYTLFVAKVDTTKYPCPSVYFEKGTIRVWLIGTLILLELDATLCTRSCGDKKSPIKSRGWARCASTDMFDVQQGLLAAAKILTGDTYKVLKQQVFDTILEFAKGEEE